MEPIDFLVCVRCFTFNHALYIEDAMNGFCMQKTNFPYVCVIVDDASTDGEPEVIRTYMAQNFNLNDNVFSKYEETDDYVMSFAQHKANEQCFYAVFFLKYNHYSNPELKYRKFQYIAEWYDGAKFIAFCEGDDCWTSPHKLQMEFNYLEGHPELALVYTNCNVFFQEGYVLHKSVFSTGFFSPTYNYKDFLLEGKYLAPCSWFYKKEVIDGLKIPSFTTDWTLCVAFTMLANNLVGYIDDTTCTYRIVPGSMSHNNDISTRYRYFKGAFASEKNYIKSFSSLFNKEDLIFLNNRRYKQILPYAVALNDKEMLKEIRDCKSLNLNLKMHVIIFLSSIKLFRKYVCNKLLLSIKKGL